MNGYPPYFDAGFGYDVYHSGGERFAGNMGRGPVGGNQGRSRHKSDKDNRKQVDRAADSVASNNKKDEEEKPGKEVIEEEFVSRI